MVWIFSTSKVQVTVEKNWTEKKAGSLQLLQKQKLIFIIIIAQ